MEICDIWNIYNNIIKIKGKEIIGFEREKKLAILNIN